jgi:hypothetical protein
LGLGLGLGFGLGFGLRVAHPRRAVVLVERGGDEGGVCLRHGPHAAGRVVRHPAGVDAVHEDLR